MNTVQLTQEGLENLRKELHELKEVKRPVAVERLQRARGMGDLSENSEYTASKEELNLIDQRIAEIEYIVKNAQITKNNSNGHEISVGSHVTVQVNGSEDKFQIVGDYEADPMNKKLSAASPIGKALLTKKVGETIEVEVPAGKMAYKIVEIK